MISKRIHTSRAKGRAFRPHFISSPLLLAVWLAMPLSARATMQEVDARQTVVIANRNVPESIELARYYMAARGIPTNHLCELDLPAGETMARWYYESKLRDPLLEFLRNRKLIEQIKRDDANAGGEGSWRTVKHQIRYLVSMYGVPLRIADSRPYVLTRIARFVEEPMQHDRASVDSELACLLWDSYEIKGGQSNPYYNLVTWNRNERSQRPVMMAARLDGPEPSVVKRMIDDALLAEKNGLHGRGYVDMRNIRDADYAIGDFWFKEAAERLSRAGFDVVLDRQEALLPELFPMEDAAIYLGWYAENAAGPMMRKGFSFRPGAIAYHLHSSSAKTLRSKKDYWAGPLLAAGAAAVMGAVDEPYLNFTPDIQIFADRICTGYSLGESAYFSMRMVSWQITIVGDPLYRPFSVGLDDRIKQLDAANNADVEWEHVRRMNFFLAQQQLNVALNYGREILRQRESLVIREKLADLFAKNELWDEALREYLDVVSKTESDVTAIRVGQRAILLLRLLNRPEIADKKEAEIKSRWPDSLLLPFLENARP
jgi:uncharacterized protein (TIGR03790 family)